VAGFPAVSSVLSLAGAAGGWLKRVAGTKSPIASAPFARCALQRRSKLWVDARRISDQSLNLAGSLQLSERGPCPLPRAADVRSLVAALGPKNRRRVPTREALYGDLAVSGTHEPEQAAHRNLPGE
jgi:hypothetical protein